MAWTVYHVPLYASASMADLQHHLVMTHMFSTLRLSRDLIPGLLNMSHAYYPSFIPGFHPFWFFLTLLKNSWEMLFPSIISPLE